MSHSFLQKYSGYSGLSGTSGYSGYQGTAYKNFIINPQMDWWQLYPTPSTLTSQSNGTYAADQWYVLTQTASVQAAQVAGPTANQGSVNAFRLKQNQASAQRCGIIQWIEGKTSYALRGHTVTLNFQVQNSAGQAVHYAIVEWTGTIDTITKNIVNDWTSGTYTTGNFFTSTSTTVDGNGTTTPSANTFTNITLSNIAVSASCNNLAVFIWSEGTMAQNATMDITAVQLTPTVFAPTYQPPNQGDDLLACQRYVQPFYCGTAVLAIGQVDGTNDISWMMPLTTPLFKSPSLVTSQTGWIHGNDGSSNVVNNATTMHAITNNQVWMSITQAGTTWTVGRAAALFGSGSTDYMILTAQL